METQFEPSWYRRLTHDTVEVQPDGTVRMRWTLQGPGRVQEFKETYQLGNLESTLAHPGRRAALHEVLSLLHLAAGLSYYKTAAPAEVVVPQGLTRRSREWLEGLYREGLGEYAHQNGIDLRERPRILAPQREVEAVVGLDLRRANLVPVGGGKDSDVTLEMLRGAGEEVVAYNVGGHQVAKETAKVAGVPLEVTLRRLDPELGALNRAGALNGHVPVTAIVSLLAVASALRVGADRVVLSNERSASSGNLVVNGLVVNHQYSKGLRAEELLAAALEEVTLELTYYSLLRPLSELTITELFAHSGKYLPVFTSCNAAFRIEESRRAKRWCANCPKCRFVYLALAPHLARTELARTFGHDLLADPEQREGYRELLGLSGHKPFECVGEEEESRVALHLTQQAGQWDGEEAYEALRGELAAVGGVDEVTIREVSEPSDAHHLPPDALKALQGALEKVRR